MSHPFDSAPVLPPDLKQSLFSRPPGVDDTRLAELDRAEDEWQARLKLLSEQTRRATVWVRITGDDSDSVAVLREETEKARELDPDKGTADAWLDAAWREFNLRAEGQEVTTRVAEGEVRRLGCAVRALRTATQTYAQELAAYQAAYEKEAEGGIKEAAEAARFANMAGATRYLLRLVPLPTVLEPDLEPLCPPWLVTSYKGTSERVLIAHDVLRARQLDLADLYERKVRPMVAHLGDMRASELRFHEGLGKHIALLGQYTSALKACARPPPCDGSIYSEADLVAELESASLRAGSASVSQTLMHELA